MAQFKYVGDPNDNFNGPRVATHYGVSFIKGEVVDLPDKTDEEKDTVRKLQGHSHFVDMSDNDRAAAIEERQAVMDKRQADRDKTAEADRVADEADEKKMLAAQDEQLRQGAPVTASTVPRPPGTVTRPQITDPFGGRPVGERTPSEDHTRAGKTKS